MTELSYFHNGISQGDALESPYSAKEFQSVWSKLITSARINGVLPIPGISNISTLGAVSAGVDMEIDVNVGSAFVEGIYFNSSAIESFELDLPITYSRWDRLVIDVNWEAQEARLSIIKGQEGAYPSLPPLQQDPGNIYQFPLSKIWVDIATKTTTTIEYYQVYDERVFIPTAQEPPIVNIMHNSEFVAGAKTGHGGQAPAYWYTTGTPTITNANSAGSWGDGILDRGSVLQVALGAGDELQTDILVGDPNTTVWGLDPNITIAFYIFVLNGVTSFTIDGFKYKEIYPSGEPVLILLRAAIDVMNLLFDGESTFYLYPVTISYGAIPAPFVPKNELILYSDTITDIDSARSSGARDKTRYLDYGTRGLPKHSQAEKAIILWQYAKDNVSSGLDMAYAELGLPANSIRTEVGRLPNAIVAHNSGLVVGLADVKNQPLKANVVASGVGTVTQTFNQVGVIV